MSKNNEKQKRLEHANELIKIIGSHGRRFFYHAKKNRYARLELRNGRVYFIDDCTGQAIYTHRVRDTYRWRGFSHGGTLKSLVEDMRDYVMKGERIERWKIVIRQLNSKGLEGNIWGYPEDEAQIVRDKAYALPIIADEPKQSSAA